MSEKTSALMRNPNPTPCIRRSESHGRPSEGDADSHRRGSDPGPRINRGSDPGPSKSRRWAAPTAAGAAPANPSRRSRLGKLTCHACGDPQPVAAFPLLEDPVAEVRRWATRHWCGECLIDGGHLTRDAYDTHLAIVLPYERLPLSSEDRAEVDARIREHQLTVQLLERVERDPAFGRALVRASRMAAIAAEETSPNP